MSVVNSMDLSSNASSPYAKSIEYLLFLDSSAGDELIGKLSLPLQDFSPQEISRPEQCIDCLTEFLDHGIWPGYLFSRKDIWFIYLYSVSEERYHKALSLLESMGTPLELILYLRACYRFGYQVISDQEYDVLEKLYMQTFPALSCLDSTTNDDSPLTPLVTEAIKYSGLRNSKEAAPKKVSFGDDYASLNYEKSTSIKPVRSYEETYQYLKDSPSCRTHWSLKMDGFNTKCEFSTAGAGLSAALSRGRATDSWDYTEAVRRMFEVNGWNDKLLSGKVTGECLVDPAVLDMFRVKYPGKDYKSPKSTAGAMLRAPQHFEVEDFKYLRFYPFEYAEHPKDEAFRLLSSAGLLTPPAIEVPAGAVPLASLEEFNAWVDSTILDPLWAEAQRIGVSSGGTDGVVLQLLDLEDSDRADKYSDLNVALKFSHWTEAEYQSVVTDIVFEQKRVEMSVVLIVEPVVTRDLNTATRVSAGSPAILVRDGVKIGDTIAFARKSEAINIYLGKR